MRCTQSRLSLPPTSLYPQRHVVGPVGSSALLTSGNLSVGSVPSRDHSRMMPLRRTTARRVTRNVRTELIFGYLARGGVM